MTDHFALRVRQRIVTLGISQAELARRAGVDRATVSRWLSGKSDPNLTQLRGLVRALGIRADELIAGAPLLRIAEGRRGEWLVFSNDEPLGAWIGDPERVFPGAVRIDRAKALRLLGQPERARRR